MIMNEEMIAHQGAQLLRRNWVVEDAIANVLFVHGLGEHTGRYTEMAGVFNNVGISLYGYDRRGEGRSDGRRTYIHSIDDQIEDLHKMKSLMPTDKPLVLMAHSLGGLIAIYYMIQKEPTDIAGLILSGALLETDPDMAPFLKKIALPLGLLLSLIHI